MKYLRQRFTIYQRVATIEGIGFIYAINYVSMICDVCLSEGCKTFKFSDLIKVF